MESHYICPFSYRLVPSCMKKCTKYALTLTIQKSPIGVSLSLSHTYIGLLWGFNLNFPTSIPVTFIWEFPPPGSYRDRSNNSGLWKTDKIQWSQFRLSPHCAHRYFISQIEGTVKEPTLLFEKGRSFSGGVVSLAHIIHIMGWVGWVINILGTLISSDATATRTSKKQIGLVSKKQLCTCSTLFCTFLCRLCTTTTWKCLFRALSRTWTSNYEILFLLLNLDIYGL